MAILNQLDHVLFREGYLDGIERRIEEITKPQKEAKSEELARRKVQLAQVLRQIQAAFRLHAEMGAEIVDDLFKDELVRLKSEKASLESSIKDLENHLDDSLPTGAQGRQTLAINLADYKKAKGGANQMLLKRLMRKVIESIVLEPERIALKYWTSNETRDESLSRKNKRPSDCKSGASVIPFQTTRSSESFPTSPEVRDDEDFGLLIVKNGRGGQTNGKPLQRHDYIDFPSLSKEGISSRAAEFYGSGLSLAQISRQLNKSKASSERHF